jgi:hypothetical protein
MEGASHHLSFQDDYIQGKAPSQKLPSEMNHTKRNMFAGSQPVSLDRTNLEAVKACR